MTKEKKERWVEEIEYENFCDSFAINSRKGIFCLLCGQAIVSPPKMLMRIWIDASSLKVLSNFLQEQIKEYEKKYGKIE